MASGGQKLPAFPRELPESGLSNRRCQPSTPHLTHTQMGLMAHWSPPCGHPAWILHYLTGSRGPSCRADTGRWGHPCWARLGQATGVLGRTALQTTTPRKMPSQPHGPAVSLVQHGAASSQGCRPLGGPHPRSACALWTGMPHALPTAQDLASAQELWWPESSNTQPVWANGTTQGGTLGNGPLL